jgi:hypothetical protein
MVFSHQLNSQNEQDEVYTENMTDIPCGLELGAGNEPARERLTTLQWDGTLRLPYGTDWDERDRVKVIKQYGETLSEPLVFDIVGPIQLGPTAVRLAIRKVTPND